MNTAGFHIARETALRTWLKTLRRPVPLTFSFVQPFLWMLIFGFLFQRFTLGPGYEGFTYLDFLLPGICVMTVLFGASQAGVLFVRDMQTGFLQRMARASGHPGWMLTGKLGADVLRLLAQAHFDRLELRGRAGEIHGIIAPCRCLPVPGSTSDVGLADRPLARLAYVKASVAVTVDPVRHLSLLHAGRSRSRTVIGKPAAEL